MATLCRKRRGLYFANDYFCNSLTALSVLIEPGGVETQNRSNRTPSSRTVSRSKIPPFFLMVATDAAFSGVHTISAGSIPRSKPSRVSS
jgi:hypothetical protein